MRCVCGRGHVDTSRRGREQRRGLFTDPEPLGETRVEPREHGRHAQCLQRAGRLRSDDLLRQILEQLGVGSVIAGSGPRTTHVSQPDGEHDGYRPSAGPLEDGSGRPRARDAGGIDEEADLLFGKGHLL